MRVAHLILAHRHPAQLERLIRALDHPDFDCYVHIDRKKDLEPFRRLEDLPRTKLIRNRTTGRWAGYLTISAMLSSFAEIPLEHYGYINVISGQDFPIQSAGKLHRFLEAHAGEEFITCESVETEWKEAEVRMKRYFLVNLGGHFPGKFRLEALVNAVMPERRFPYPFKVVGRANWFTLTPDSIRYILRFSRENPRYRRFFWWVWGADELYFSTLIFNHPDFRIRVRPNLVFAEWTGEGQGHARNLTIKDFPVLQTSAHFFARKIDIDTDEDLLVALESWIGRPTAL